MERFVYMVIWIHWGRSREMKLQVRLNSKESCTMNFINIPFHFRISPLYCSEVLVQKEDGPHDYLDARISFSSD